MTKTLVITEWAPPLNEGSPIMMKNLFQYFPKGNYCILMDTLKENYRRVDKSYVLDCSYYFFNVPICRGGNRIIDRFFTLLELFLLPFLAIKGVRVAIKEGADNILAPTNNRGFFLSAYFVHRIMKKPLYLFMFDLFEEIQLSRIKKHFCKWLEKRMFNTATKVFVTTERMKTYYKRKYGIDTELIQHSVELPPHNEYTPKHYKSKDIYKIVYTGSVYSAQYDSIVRLVNVVNELTNVNLFLYTTPRQGKILEENVKLSKRIIITYAVRKDIFQIQRDADILFLPYTFRSDYLMRVIVENQAPGKIAEYFISGTPILLHAPPYSYLCQYNKENEFALTVDEPSEKALQRGILQLLKDKQLRERIVHNALATARKHDAKRNSMRLQKYLFD